MRLAAAALTLLLHTAACAVEIEGINLRPQVQSRSGGPVLVLNGAGVRVRFVFKVYVAALYLPEKSADAEAILRADQPMRFVMHLLRELTAEQINSSMSDAVRETLTPEERQPLDARHAALQRDFQRPARSQRRYAHQARLLAGRRHRGQYQRRRERPHTGR